jgi:2-methylisocitrate lyase-like PEP mutase family enzyme
VTGVYDVFSATVAARHLDGVFIGGFGFSASYHGLPDIDRNAWSDVVAFVERVRTVLPRHSISVDLDDGFEDT